MNFFINSTGDSTEPIELVKELRDKFRQIRPIASKRHGSRKIFIYKDLATVSRVFLRVDAIKGPLENSYSGLFRVISRSDKTFVIKIKGKDVRVSIDRIKPAYLLEGMNECNEPLSRLPLRSSEQAMEDAIPSSESVQTRSGRRVIISLKKRLLIFIV